MAVVGTIYSMRKDIYFSDPFNLQALVQGYGEPCVVVNQELDVLATNDGFQKVGRFLTENARAGCRLSESMSADSRDECALSGLAAAKPDAIKKCACEARILGVTADTPLYLVVLSSNPVEPDASLYSLFAGNSALTQKMVRMIKLVASGDNPVVVLGESGAGKARVAKAIHEASVGRDQPFVPVDCAGLTGEQFDHILFGSIDGQRSEKQGLLDKIEGGSLFLSSINKLPLAQQFKLLQLLETSQYTRLGGVDRLHADFRFLCATSEDLYGLVEDGRFRRDLYYEISVCPITVPSLKDRPDDIPKLSRSLLYSLYPKKQSAPLIHPDTFLALMQYNFPGNIRELKSLLTRACLFAEDGVVFPKSLPSTVREAAENQSNATVPDSVKKIISLKNLERRYLAEVFEQFEGQKIDLADQLGISQRTLYRKLRKLKNADSTA